MIRATASTIVGLVPVALVIVAEAAWISVVAGLVGEFAFHEPVLGIPAFAVFVTVGVAAARLLGQRLGRSWPVVALGLTVGAGIVGWLASPAARAAIGDGLGPALLAHPAGWTAGLAVLRGYAHARLPLPEGTVARLLGLGVPGLAIAAIVGGVIGEPYRSRFLADTLGASIVFILAAMIALALTRLTTVGEGAGFDWRRNPRWLGLALGLLVLAIVVAVPLSIVVGTAIETVFAVALAPMLVVGLLTGLDRTVRRTLAVIFGGGLVLFIVIRIFAGNPNSPNPVSGVPGGQGRPPVADQVMTISLAGLLLVAAVIAILVLAAVWMERTRPPGDDRVEEFRTIDRGVAAGAPRRRLRWFERRPDPAGAAAAYVALVHDLDRHPEVRREGAETPAEHAARLRSLGRDALSLDLLAADYALDRFGGVALPERENRRAVGRWRMLRRRLTRESDRSGRRT